MPSQIKSSQAKLISGFSLLLERRKIHYNHKMFQKCSRMSISWKWILSVHFNNWLIDCIHTIKREHRSAKQKLPLSDIQTARHSVAFASGWRKVFFFAFFVFKIKKTEYGPWLLCSAFFFSVSRVLTLCPFVCFAITFLILFKYVYK